MSVSGTGVFKVKVCTYKHIKDAIYTYNYRYRVYIYDNT